MTDDDLKTWAALAEKATPGPWTPNVEADPPHPGTFYVTVPVQHHATLFLDATPYPGSEQFEWTHNACDARAKADIEFIAAARTAVPALIAEVRRLKASEIDLRRIAICIYDSRPDDTIGSLKVYLDEGGAEYLADHVVSVLKRHAGQAALDAIGLRTRKVPA